MNVSKRPVGLVGIEFNQKGWYWLFHLIVVFKDPINGFWDIVHDHIQIYFIWLYGIKLLTVQALTLSPYV